MSIILSYSGKLEKNNLWTFDTFTKWIKDGCDELQGLKAIQLNISNCNLTNIPDKVFLLTNLIHLDCSNNKLTSISPKIKQLQNLQSLHCVNNNITQFPNELLECTKLTYISHFSVDKKYISYDQLYQMISIIDRNMHYDKSYPNYISKPLKYMLGMTPFFNQDCLWKTLEKY